MLRAQPDRAADCLAAADKTAEAVVLEQVACDLAASVTIGQFRQLAFSVVGISNVSTISIHFFAQSVNVAASIIFTYLINFI